MLEGYRAQPHPGEPILPHLGGTPKDVLTPLKTSRTIIGSVHTMEKIENFLPWQILPRKIPRVSSINNG
jgi:hypothetical protein